MQTASTRASEFLAGAPLDNGDVDASQRQLARQHQPGRASSGDHHRMLGHRHTPVGITPVATSASHSSGQQLREFRMRATGTFAASARNCTASPTIGSTSPRDPYVDNNARIFATPITVGSGLAGDYAARPGACRKPPCAYR
jgi:hypothetical protein